MIKGKVSDFWTSHVTKKTEQAPPSLLQGGIRPQFVIGWNYVSYVMLALRSSLDDKAERTMATKSVHGRVESLTPPLNFKYKIQKLSR